MLNDQRGKLESCLTVKVNFSEKSLLYRHALLLSQAVLLTVSLFFQVKTSKSQFDPEAGYWVIQSLCGIEAGAWLVVRAKCQSTWVIRVSII